MKKRRFTITIEDIELGIPRTSWACAISQVMHREYPGLVPEVVPVIGGHEIRLYEYVGSIQPVAELRHQFRISGNGSRWIRRYDQQGVGQPATFEMTEKEVTHA